MVCVSVIVPFFNASNTIKATLNSIIKQSFKDFECILINDASTDESLKFVNQIVSSDKRFKVFNQKKKGVVSARNLGIKYSKGRLITFLDADDLWHHDFLKESIDFRKKYNYPIAITHTSYVRFSLKNDVIKSIEINPPKEICHNNILNKNHLPLLTTMIDREVIKKLKFDKVRPEDYKLWINLIYVKKYKSISIEKNLAFYRISDLQRSKNKILSIIRIYKFFLKLPNTNWIYKNLNIFKWLFFNISQRLFTKELRNKNLLEYLKYELLEIK